LKNTENLRAGFSDSCYYQNASDNSLFVERTVKNARTNLLSSGAKKESAEWKCLEGLKSEDKLDFRTLFNCHCRGKASCEIPAITESAKLEIN